MQRHQEQQEEAEKRSVAQENVEALVVLPDAEMPLSLDSAERKEITLLLKYLAHREETRWLSQLLTGPHHLPERALKKLFQTLQDPFEDLWTEQLLAAWACGRADLTHSERDQAIQCLSFLL